MSLKKYFKKEALPKFRSLGIDLDQYKSFEEVHQRIDDSGLFAYPATKGYQNRVEFADSNCLALYAFIHNVWKYINE